jgi:hypothetical protein
MEQWSDGMMGKNENNLPSYNFALFQYSNTPPVLDDIPIFLTDF